MTEAGLEESGSVPSAHFDSLAHLEGSYWWHLSRLNWAQEIISKQILSHGKLNVLDYGCGTGGFLHQLDSRLHFKSCKGVDISAKAIELARKYGDHYSLIAPGDFSVAKDKDLVFLMDALEHIQDDEIFLKQLLEALNPGAMILLSVPAHQFLYSSWDETLGHHRRYSKAGLESLVETAGGKIRFVIQIFSYLAPAILFKRVLGNEQYESDTCEFPPVPGSLNDALIFMNRLEIFLSGFIKPPLGSSIICLIEK